MSGLEKTNFAGIIDHFNYTYTKENKFFLLNFKNCKFRAKYFYEKLKMKGIILRSTENGYNIKNMLRLTIGSKTDNLKFMRAVKGMFN